MAASSTAAPVSSEMVAQATHLCRSSLSLTSSSPSTAAHLGYEVLRLQAADAESCILNADQILTNDLARNAFSRKIYAHLEMCEGCGSCLLPGENARRIVRFGQSCNGPALHQNQAKSKTPQPKLPRLSKRRKAAWGPPRSVHGITASEDDAESAKRAGAIHPFSEKMERTKDRVVLTCNKCGRRTRMDLEPTRASAKASARPNPAVHQNANVTAMKSSGPPSTSAPSVKTTNTTSSNERSKRRAKARKQGGLTAELDRRIPGGGGGGVPGLDLMDFMKSG